jgi:hypothetical protein
LPDIVQPSKNDICSRTISAIDRSLYPLSRSLTKKAFSVRRVASHHRVIPCRRHRAATSRRLAIDTGWPPAMFTENSSER